MTGDKYKYVYIDEVPFSVFSFSITVCSNYHSQTGNSFVNLFQAVLVRVAADSLWREGASEQDKKIAEQHANIIVIAILLMTTLGSGLTTILGPILLSQDTKIRDSGWYFGTFIYIGIFIV